MITILCVSAEDTFNLKDDHIKESITASIEKLPISYAEFKKIANNKSMTSLLQIQEFKNDVNKNLIKCMYKQGTTEIQKFSERFDNFLDSVQNDCDDEGSLHMLKNWRYNNTTLPLKKIIKYIGNLDIMYTHLELPELKRFNVSIESPDYNFYFSHILYPIYCIKNNIIDLN